MLAHSKRNVSTISLFILSIDGAQIQLSIGYCTLINLLPY